MLDADGLITMLKAMSPKSRKIFLDSMDEDSKIQIIVFDLYNRLGALCNALDVNVFTVMKLPSVLALATINNMDSILKKIKIKNEKDKAEQLEGQDAINKVAEKILKEMEEHERKGQSKDPGSKRTTSKTPGKGPKNVH